MSLAALITDFPTSYGRNDAHFPLASGGPTSQPAKVLAETKVHSRAGTQTPEGDANVAMLPMKGSRSLLDPLLALASITLDDLEELRIAQENRYRSLTTTGTSENGLEWGYGLDDRDPNVAAAGAIVDQIKVMEHQATLQLQRLMRKHPLGPWVKATKGVGEKQAARLLGILGDPYWHSAEERPRTVSELWAYCGLRPGQRRRKGERANWSADAKMRVWLIATSCIKAGGPYREVYDARRAHTAERVHDAECIRCGPSGVPAQPGSAWSAGHQHADALRVMSKAILRDLWRESKRIHEAH